MTTDYKSATGFLGRLLMTYTTDGGVTLKLDKHYVKEGS